MQVTHALWHATISSSPLQMKPCIPINLQFCEDTFFTQKYKLFHYHTTSLHNSIFCFQIQKWTHGFGLESPSPLRKWHIVGTSLAGSSIDYHVSITLSSSFLVSFVALWFCLLHIWYLLPELYFMRQIYSMESQIDTAQPQTCVAHTWAQLS